MADKKFVSGTLVADRVGSLLDCVPGVLKARQFDEIVDRVTVAGHWSLLVVAVLGLLVELVAAISYNGSAILWGLGWLVALPLLQYTAVQFLGVTRELVQSNRTQLSSEAFLRCYALVALVAAILILVGSIVWAVDAGRLQVFLFGLAFTALSVATAWLALNPSLLAITVNRGSTAGEEALGILSFFVKTGVRLVPIFYGVTLLVGAIYGVLLLLGMIGDTKIELIGAVGRAELSAPMLLWAALSPFLAYIAFVFYFLVIDLLRGILSIPGAMAGDRGGRSSGSSRKKSASKKKSSSKKAASRSSASGTG
ncbi:MAG: hypothetical protein U5K33_04420 [Halofilum sp. (in: g-proteobacteria)]|nr:hypothetical protein [Halofilum sp. (in: g-proteobacteria)]